MLEPCFSTFEGNLYNRGIFEDNQLRLLIGILIIEKQGLLIFIVL